MKLNLVLKVCPEESIIDLKSNMSQMLADPSNSDFEIVCGQGEETKFKVHKLILATRSSVFKAMFNSIADNKESQNGQVKVPDIDPVTMKALLKFIYTDFVSKNDITMALFYASDKYDLKKLTTFCEKVLMNHFDTENVIDILIECQDCMTAKNIEESAKAFIVENVGQIVKTPSWNDLMEKNPRFGAQILEYVVFHSC